MKNLPDASNIIIIKWCGVRFDRFKESEAESRDINSIRYFID
jgi:hypothetical protein